MKPTRRQTLAALAGATLAGLTSQFRLPQAQAQTSAPSLDYAPGPFKPTRESLAAYQPADWFRDAKFGIWSHWGPQSAAEYGDWYARNMYTQGSAQYEYHVKTYGHPSKVGFKDVIPTWKAALWDPNYLMDLYKKAGAKYFVSMGVHHDGFELWNTSYPRRWNAVNAGPHKDIVGLWQKAARDHGLRFGVSEHLVISFGWFATSHLSDKTGPLAGVPYDGADPAFSDLYHDYSEMPANFAKTSPSVSRNVPDSWKATYFQRISDLVNQYEPDLLYTDGGVPFGNYGLTILANHYNRNIARHGKLQALYMSKTRQDAADGICSLDIERGIIDGVSPAAWQTDTCIGNWHYDKRIFQKNSYKTPKFVIDMLCDIVSRNGNLLLNFPLPNSGALDDLEMKTLDGITRWMAVNSEGIYATRPYKIFGDGPYLASAPTTRRFNETGRKSMTADDVRFTTKGDALYAFVMDWPGRQASIPSLATNAKQGVSKIQSVELLGSGKVPFTHDETGLKVTMPENPPCEHAITLKIMGA